MFANGPLPGRSRSFGPVPRALTVGVLLSVVLLSLGGSAFPSLEAASNGGDFDKAKAHLMAALDAGRRAETSRVVGDLAKTGDPRAVRLLVVVGSNDTTAPVYPAVLEALASQSSEEWIAELGENLKKSRNAEGAILIVGALAKIDSPATVEPLITALEIPRPPVLLAALRAARAKHDRALIEPLLTVLEDVTEDASTLWAECRITLQILTGEQFLAVEDWRNWWSNRPDDWQPVASRKRGGKATTSVYRPKGEGIALPRIFGSEVASKRVVFVIDCSSSMSKIDPPKHVEEGSVRFKGKSRLQRAQAELIAAIDQLRPEVRFNVIAYSTEVSPWVEDKLVRASKGAKRKAMRFVNGMAPTQFTNSGAALLTAMEFSDVDTIYFLSDGSPTNPETGKVVDVEPILEAVDAVNRKKNITIHTLGFKGAKESFMEALADSSGGTYAPIE